MLKPSYNLKLQSSGDLTNNQKIDFMLYLECNVVPAKAFWRNLNRINYK